MFLKHSRCRRVPTSGQASPPVDSVLTIDGVKPGDHPEFFRFPAPEGRSRESSIRLDAHGQFFHEGAVVEHPGLAAAMHTWIGVHPDDGRFILTNGYDWTYFTVEDVPYFVRTLRVEPERAVLVLSDGTEEPWDPTTTAMHQDRLYARVKAAVRGGPFRARFLRHAQAALTEVLELVDGAPWVRLGALAVPLGGGLR
jgi:hypothetical protein